MEILIVFLYFCFFSLLAWRNFRIALIFFVILLPSYLIRFNLGPLSSTALEVAFGALFLVWLAKYSRRDLKNIFAVSQKHKILFIAFDLLLLASVVSIFVSDMWWFSLGEWRAYFLEPMIFFLILISRCHSHNNGNPDNRPLDSRFGGEDRLSTTDLIWALAISTLSISIYSIVQKFTGWGIATPEFASEATRRVTAFFSSPNAVGLYLAPILMLMVFVIANEVKQSQSTGGTNNGIAASLRLLAMTMLAVLSLIAIIFTKSQGAWIGLVFGLLVFLFFLGYKKIVVVTAILGVIFSLVSPALRQAVLFQDQAGQNRLRLWGYTWTFLSRSPKDFVLGTGVRQFFRKVQKPHYDKKVMERLIYPHNIFLNFWTEVGLLGMAAAVIMMGYSFFLSYEISRHNKILGASLLSALTVLVAHGLVDVPYFKNDLSFLFWIVLSLPIILCTEGISSFARK